MRNYKKISVLVILVCVAFLLGYGLVMLYSIDSSPARFAHHYSEQTPFFVRQLMWIGIGLVVMLVMAKIDYQFWRRFALFFFWMVLVMFFLVLILSLIHPTHDETIWHINIQLSELSKLTVILFLAQYMARRQKVLEEARVINTPHADHEQSDFFRRFYVPFVVILIGTLPIVAAPDFSSALVIVLGGLIVMYLGGARLRYFIASFCSVFVGWLFLILYFAPYRLMQLLAALTPDQHKFNSCSCTWLPCRAFCLGGWTGVGLGHSQTVQHFYPESASEFMAPVIGEELGFVGMIFLLLAFIMLIASGIYISMRARDLFGTLLGMGIAYIIGLQALIHLAFLTKLIPFRSLPLPFISYNGFGLVVTLAGVGLLLSIAQHTD